MIQPQTRSPMAPETRQPSFETSDLNAAAALMAAHVPLDRTLPGGGR